MAKPDDKPQNPNAANPAKPGGPGTPATPATPAKKEPEVDNSLPDDPSEKEEAVLMEKAPKRPINPVTGKKYKKGEIPAGWNRPCE